jgi:transcriptional regulator with XRE-family HTH domain
MNALAKHIEATPGKPMREWAQEMNISRPYLIGLKDGTRSPSLETAQKIARATGGKVPVESWPNIAALISALKTDAA